MPTVVFITSGTSYTVPSDCTSADVECIGGGGGGAGCDAAAADTPAGGGGGAYSKQTGIALTPSSSVTIQVGTGGAGGIVVTGGNGGDTWFNGTSFATASVSAKGGNGGNGATRGVGGATTGVGALKYAGGAGGVQGNIFTGGSGGGGAAGPSGAGGSGGATTGATAGAGTGGGGANGGGNGGSAPGANGTAGGVGPAPTNTAGGAGGVAGNGGGGSNGSGGGGGSEFGNGGIGGSGIEWIATAGGTAGAGGGGGGGGDNSHATMGAGLYGGGGGGSGYGVNRSGGNGRQGIIVLTYTPTGGATTSTLMPDADSIAGTWTNELGGASLYASIDEATAGDSDYIISSDRPVSDVCKIRLSNPAGNVTTPFTVSYRYKKQGSEPINLRVRLLEGTTQIASWTHTAISATFVDATQTLSGGEVAAIGDPTNLFLEFQASV